MADNAYRNDAALSGIAQRHSAFRRVNLNGRFEEKCEGKSVEMFTKTRIGCDAAHINVWMWCREMELLLAAICVYFLIAISNWFHQYENYSVKRFSC